MPRCCVLACRDSVDSSATLAKDHAPVTAASRTGEAQFPRQLLVLDRRLGHHLPSQIVGQPMHPISRRIVSGQQFPLKVKVA